MAPSEQIPKILYCVIGIPESAQSSEFCSISYYVLRQLLLQAGKIITADLNSSVFLFT